MATQSLIHSTSNRRAMGQDKVTVVGLGYVGIPLSVVLAAKGFQVVGIDYQDQRVESINAGRLPLKGDEPGLQKMLSKAVKGKRLKATTGYAACKDSTAIFICVDTPIDSTRRPDYSRLE